MKSKNIKTIILLLCIVAIIFINFACFTIIKIRQPSSVMTGQRIKVKLLVRTEDTDANPHYGILGLLVPNDWTVEKVRYTGDFGPDEMSLLPPGTPDNDPGGQVDYWNESLEEHYPSGDDMKWVVFQANTPYTAEINTGYVVASIRMIVGDTPGNFDIGYFVTNAALDFTDPSYYSIDLGNSITVQNCHGVTSSMVPKYFSLEKNFPNPFNPETAIQFQLPEASHVALKIFNMLGEEVRTLVNCQYQAGYHTIKWDGTDNFGNHVSNGVYLYRIHAGNFSKIMKMSLLR